MSFSGGLGDAGLMIGLRGGFQPKQFCDSISDPADTLTRVHNLNLELSHHSALVIYESHLNKARL